MRVPLLDLREQFAGLKDEILKEIGEVCDSQMFILGKKVEKLENEISAYCGSKYSCGVTSGSDALIIALMIEGIGAGDEVLVPAMTFVATANVVQRLGDEAVEELILGFIDDKFATVVE